MTEIEVAVWALRRRAARQASIARAGAVVTADGVVVRRGEAVIAQRLAETLAGLADELEQAR